jgi:predicted RNase H-like HicB family nuclease
MERAVRYSEAGRSTRGDVRFPSSNALCPELNIANEGASIDEARTNLIEALTLFFETVDLSEVDRRFHSEVFVTQVEVPVG